MFERSELADATLLRSAHTRLLLTFDNYIFGMDASQAQVDAVMHDAATADTAAVAQAISPVPAEVDPQVSRYAGYPPFVQASFTLDTFRRGFQDMAQWPRHLFISVPRNGLKRMCQACEASPSVQACVYSDGREICILCQINGQPCVEQNPLELTDSEPQAKRRRILTPKMKASIETTGKRKAPTPVEVIPISRAATGSKAAVATVTQTIRSDLSRSATPATTTSAHNPQVSPSNPAHVTAVEDRKGILRAKMALIERRLIRLDMLETNLLKYGAKAMDMTHT
ncbi:hypothetical protein BDW22DRAFT_1423646 [Trametopsis cervina]|nr:hypothetical protein BDW22DRAFT_1423646 [Trametopsis cervina]